MKKSILKVLSVVLTVVMLLSVAMPAFAAVDYTATRSQIPTIRLRGDGTEIVDKDGNRLPDIWSLGGLLDDDEDEEDDGDNSELMKSVANVLLPFLIDGIAFDNWEPYYKNLQKEISEIFGDLLLDENGEASNGSGLREIDIKYNNTSMNTDYKSRKGYYDPSDYLYLYDWRLDPMQTADELNDYIEAVKKTTGAEKVAIVANCLGGSVAMAYLAKYGTESICGVGFDSVVFNGQEPMSEALSGKFKVDGNAIYRTILDNISLENFELSPFILTTIELVEKSGAFDTIVGVGKALLYEKLVEGVTSALALATVATFPGYWTTVSAGDYSTALNFVFGPKGSEKRETYAGMIEKLDNYDKNVRQRIPEILNGLVDDGVNLGIISKYGFQMMPICQSVDKVADNYLSTESSSFGATTSTVYDTLSDKYIAKQEAAGLGKYISPDKKVDASTCMFPDYTWFLKGVEHNKTTYAQELFLMTVATADRQLTVDDFDMGQYMLYENGRLVAMTEENCNTEAWDPVYKEDHPSNLFERLFAFIKTLIKWFGEIGKLLSA